MGVRERARESFLPQTATECSSNVYAFSIDDCGDALRRRGLCDHTVHAAVAAAVRLHTLRFNWPERLSGTDPAHERRYRQGECLHRTWASRKCVCGYPLARWAAGYLYVAHPFWDVRGGWWRVARRQIRLHDVS